MILLTSNGLSSDSLLREAGQYIESGKAALVVTADNEYKEQNHHVPRLTQELQSLGCAVECFDFDTQSPSALAAYDVVELIGGNPYYLLHSIRQNGFTDCLRQFADKKILIGCSAGSLVLTPTLNLINLYSPELNFVGLTDLTGCNFTDVQILPHYSKFLNRYKSFEETCAQYEAEYNCSVIRLNDGDGVWISKDSKTVIKK